MHLEPARLSRLCKVCEDELPQGYGFGRCNGYGILQGLPGETGASAEVSGVQEVTGASAKVSGVQEVTGDSAKVSGVQEVTGDSAKV